MMPDICPNKAVNFTTNVHGLFLLGVLIAVLSGCGAKDFDAVRAGLELRGHYIEGVPFVKQSEYDCGPAALASVLSFHGKTADLARITENVYLPALRGTLPMDMERFAKDEGFSTSSSAGTSLALKNAVKKNIPVICLLDLGIGLYRQPHFITIIGFDEGNGLYIMHDGVTPSRTMRYVDFEKKWARAGNWMLVITP